MSVLNYKHLEWDSEFFNYKVAEIRLNTTTEPLLLETISELKKQNYSLIYLFLDNKVNFENKLFSIKLVDEKKTYLKNIDEQNIYFNDIIAT